MNGAPPMAKEEADGGTPPLASTLAPHVESKPLSRKREASTAADDASGTDLLHPFRSLPDIRPAYFYPVDAFAQPEPVPCDPSMTAEVFTGNEGVPVFTPSMEEFRDFYKFCSAIDAWGMKSGIVKVVPPSEWTDALPSLRREDAQRAAQQGVSDPACIERVRIKNSIVQHFLQAGPGIWRQTNVTRTAKVWDAKQWADTCAHPDQRGPSLARARRKVDAALAAEAGDTNRGGRGVRTRSGGGGDVAKREAGSARAPRRTHAKETSPSEWDQFDYEHGWLREAADAESAEASTANGHQSSSASALTPASWDALTCRALEAEYWRGVNMGKPPMYGADLQGTLFDDRTRSWNVGKLDSLLTRLRLRRPLPGVTTPYLYFGMWRASFAWHVEDMDLHSINYIHFGAPKQWYTIRQADRKRFESIMSAAFPIDSRQCPSFMRHKAFLASPSFLASQGVRPLRLVQHAREFVITYPYGYHSGYNMGFNCAESVNFALPSWVEIGRHADYCKCARAQESVHMDVDAMLAENSELAGEAKASPAAKRRRTPVAAEVRANGISPPAGRQVMPCVFCPSTDHENLVPIPLDAASTLTRAAASRKTVEHCEAQALHAHRLCASFIPETWVTGAGKQALVQGADAIEAARWALKCQACADAQQAKHGAKIQCTKGKCPRAVHVSCALNEAHGWFIDYCEESVADQLEGAGRRSNGTAQSTSTSQVANGSPGADGEPAAPEQADDDAAVEERLVVLCRTHNPLWQEQEALRRYEALRTRAASLIPGTWIHVKVGGSTWATVLRAVDEERAEVTVDREPGEPDTSTMRILWSRILWDAGDAEPQGAAKTPSEETRPGAAQQQSQGSRPHKPKSYGSAFVASDARGASSAAA